LDLQHGIALLLEFGHRAAQVLRLQFAVAEFSLTVFGPIAIERHAPMSPLLFHVKNLESVDTSPDSAVLSRIGRPQDGRNAFLYLRRVPPVPK